MEGCYRYLKEEYRALNAGCMINHYMPVTIEQLIKNNNEFEENYRWEIYGNHKGLKELENGTWLFPSRVFNEDDIFIDEGDIHWAFSEWFRKGLTYHYYIDGERDHEHTFEAVMYTAYKNADTFEIKEDDIHEYSKQELEYLKTIVEKQKAEKGDNNGF